MTTEPVRTWASAEAAEAYRKGAALRAVALAAVTEWMFEAAGLRHGFRVLDMAAGTGEQTVLAAQRVGPTGSVLATDISASMLEVAAQAIREAGLDNVKTVVADASTLDLGPEAEDAFDAALCRFGLMFMPDLHQVLTRIRRALKPGARLAAAVWSTEHNNAYIGLQVGLVREMGRMPSPEPTLVLTGSLSAPGRLEQIFIDAGFVERSVNVARVPVLRQFGDVEDALAAMRANSPARSELLQLMSEAEQEYYWAELGRRLLVYVQPDGGCLVPGEALVGVGMK